ncbi:MAG: HAMP domain-containing sensor histidine kinase [Anaeromyxobacter sp.]
MEDVVQSAAPPPPAEGGDPARHAFHDRLQALAFGSRWRVTRRWVYVACDLVHAAFAVLLWWSGYPGWRVAVYSGALAVAVVLHLWVERPALRRLEEEGRSRHRDRAELAWLFTMLLEIAVTGGVRSPLFPSNLAAVPLNLMQFGRSRQANTAAAAILGCALAFALSPVAWTGPSVSPAVYWATLAGAVLATGGSSLYYWALLNRVAVESVRESLRAREALASHALGRARELEQLVSKISHELKNPLTAVKTLVQVSARTAEDPASRERLQVAEREVTRIQATLHDYLTLSRPLDLLSPEPVQLAALVDDVLASVAARADEVGVKLQRQGDALVSADRRRIAEALLNLVMNGIEASPRGGVVRVGIAEHVGVAHLTVSDQGRGMPREVLARLGTPFFTTRDEGTGLGVTLARSAFVQHGGTLEYASAPGEGTTATATLGLASAPEPRWRAS